MKLLLGSLFDGSGGFSLGGLMSGVVLKLAGALGVSNDILINPIIYDYEQRHRDDDFE